MNENVIAGFFIKVFSIIDERSRALMPVAILFAFVFSALEVVGIALVLPFLQALTGQSAELPEFAITFISSIKRLMFGQSEVTGGAVEDLALLFFGAFVMKNLAGILLLRWNYRYAMRIKGRLTERLFSLYLSAPLEWHLKKNAAAVIRNFQMSYQVVSAIIIPGILSLPDVMLLVLIGVVLFQSSSVAVLASGGMLGAVVYLNHRITRSPVKKAGKEAVDSYSAVVQRIMECLGAAREIQLLGAEKNMIGFFKENNDQLLHAQYMQTMLQTMPRYILEIAFVCVAAGLFLIGLQWSDQSNTLPLVGLFAFAAIRMLPAISRLVTTVQQIRTSLPALDVIYNDIESISGLMRNEQGNAPLDNNFQWEKLEMKSAEILFSEREFAALKKINFELLKGESLGVVGATGAGKSTFINLLTGFLTPTNGSVSLNGQPLSDLRRDWQGRIGFVPQHIFLLDDTIRRNIALGLPSEAIDEEALSVATHLAHLDEVIAELPDGINTVVGERGARLSGGQVQRVGIARALYRNPPILILDEATSSLDNETERKVYESIQNQMKGRTIINIAHRLSTIRYMDRIVFLKDGEIIDQGTFDELSERNPEFKKMVRSHVAPVDAEDRQIV